MGSANSIINARSNVLRMSPVTRVVFLCGLLVFSMFGLHIETACGATFRVDDTSMTVPAILNGDWRAVKVRKMWAKADGKEVGAEPRFSRFLARDYSFTVSGPAMRIKTTWFAGGKCVSTDEPVSALTSSKKMAIESAIGSLNEMHHRLHENPEASESRVVIWAHFKLKHDVTVPVEALAAEDAATLAPFADLAKQSFETRLFGNVKCKESEEPQDAREAAQRGGRRMQPSKSQSGTRLSSARTAPPRSTGGLVAGALPQAGSTPVRPDRRMEDHSAEKQKWPILISQFVARAGSLVFEPAGSFTRCVTARSEPEAIALMRATYRPQVSSGNGKRTSYTITGGAGGCGQSSGGGGSPESTESGIPGSNGAGESEPSVAPGGIDTFVPFPDPLEVDPSYYDDESPGEFDEYDLEAIPTSEESAGEMVEGESDFEQPPSDSTEPSES